MSFSPKAHTVALAVLCVRSLCSLCLCGENLLFVAVLHRTRMVAARMSTTPSFNDARPGAGYEAFSRLCASPISVDRFPHSNKNSKINFQCHQM